MISVLNEIQYVTPTSSITEVQCELKHSIGTIHSRSKWSCISALESERTWLVGSVCGTAGYVPRHFLPGLNNTLGHDATCRHYTPLYCRPELMQIAHLNNRWNLHFLEILFMLFPRTVNYNLSIYKYYCLFRVVNYICKSATRKI